MTSAQLAAATGEAGVAKESQLGTSDKKPFAEIVNAAAEANADMQEFEEEKRSVFIDKFEDIGMLDPAGPSASAPSAKGKPAGKSPNKKGGKDGASKKPSLKKI